MAKKAKSLSKNGYRSFRYTGRKKVLIVALVIVTLIIFGSLLWFRYENAQFEKVFSSVPGANWQEVSKEHYGNRFCLDACLGESRTYKTNISRDNAIDEFTMIIKQQGFTVSESDSTCGMTAKNEYTSSICSVRGVKGNLYLSLSLNLDDKTDSSSNTNISVHFGHDNYLFGYFDDE